MEVKISDLWEELELDESLKEYIERKVDEEIKEINTKVNEAIKCRIKTAIKDMKKDIELYKGFAECADAKINRHLLAHQQIPSELEKV